MPQPRPGLEEIARKRARTELDAQRDRRRDMLVTALVCVGWCALSLYLIGWSFHTTDEERGQIAFLGGLIVGNGGIVWTLARAYVRGEQRGDW
jgi:hypothetical protein